MISESWNAVVEIHPPSIIKVIVRGTELNNKNTYALQIRASLCYKLLQIGAASLLQTGSSVITSWGSYYKLRQPLLQKMAAITNWLKMYYKSG